MHHVYHLALYVTSCGVICSWQQLHGSCTW